MVIRFLQEQGWAKLLVRSETFKVATGSIVSLLPLGRCDDVCLAGLAWTLEKHTWNLGEMGVSNRAILESISIGFTGGPILLFVETSHA